MADITICLNMIVKNESHIIERLLSSVIDIIDTYCIEDTGSTDNTVELIQNFFDKRGMKGKIIIEPFKHFAYNRTHAMQCANGMSDYLLFIDSDMILEKYMNKKQILEKLVKNDVFYVYQGSDIFYYKNVRFAKNDGKSKYITPTHEYFAPPEGSTYGTFTKDELFINDRGDGGSKQNKAERDIRLLSTELITDPKNERCIFYLANSYRDIGDDEKAIEYYKKRVEVGGWIEEQWQSLYNIGNIYKKQGQIEKAIYYWLEAYNKYPRRIENLYEIIKHYRYCGNTHLAYHFYLLADYERTHNKNWDYLFLHRDIYDFKIDYELSIIGYYCNRDNFDLPKVCMKVISHPCVDDGTTNNVLMNYKFYTCDIVNKYAIATSSSDKNLQLLTTIGNEQNNGDFVSSTPSICFGKNEDELFVCLRYVNYYIDNNGNYINKEQITTHNYVAKINIKNNNWKITGDAKKLQYNTIYDARYVGLEDVRIFSLNDKTYYNANRGIEYDKMKIEHGDIDFENGKTMNSTILTKENERQIEKNWVLFERNGDLQCVYKWFPLTIGSLIASNDDGKQTFIQSFESYKNMPCFFKHLRGSTNGVVVENEIWFLCHIVSYEDRRYYYHLFVVLDKTTLQLKKYTPLFTFQKEKVEYTLGFVYFKDTNRFLIGYSIMDKETKYAMIGKHIFDNMMLVV